MKTLFEVRSTQTTLNIDINFKNLLTKHKSNLKRLIEKEQRSTKNVPGDHILVSTIIQGNVYDTDNSTIFHAAVSEKENEIANAVGITNSNSNGRVFEDEFYPGKNILILDRTSLGAMDLLNIGSGQWRKLQPIKAIRIPKNWNPLNVPKPYQLYRDVDTDDYSVISINIATLMFMWHQWMEEQKDIDYDDRDSLYTFISKYPMTNILYSQQAAFTFNCLDVTSDDDNNLLDPYQNAMFLKDYGSYLKKTILHYQEHNFNKESDFTYLIKNSASILNNGLVQDLPKIEDFQTVHNYWVIAAGYSRLVSWYGNLTQPGTNSTQSTMKLRYKSIVRKLNNKSNFNFCPDPKLKGQLTKTFKHYKTLWN